jgi:TonB family protein
MHSFCIAILVSFPLLNCAGFSQGNSSSNAPSSASRAADSAADSQTPPSSPLGSGPAPSTPFRVCDEKKNSACAKAPRTIKAPDPEYSKEAKKKKIEGIVVLYLIVGADGLPRDIRIARSVGYGLDEEAIKAAKKWKFKPATIKGRAVSVAINIEMDFRLY